MANAQLLPIVNNLSVGNGNCWVYTYAAGTNTSQTTYATNAGASGASNPNPLQLNSNGYYNTGIWGVGYYKIIIKDPTNTTTLLTLDNVSGGEAPVTPTGGGGTTTATTLNPAINRLDNTDFNYSNLLQSDGSTIGSLSNNTVIANDWTILTQSGAIAASKLKDSSNSLSPTYLRITQSQSTAQRFGIIQAIHNSSLVPLLGQTIQLSCQIRPTVASNWYICAVIQTNTTPGSPNLNCVNNWANPLITSGNFFVVGSDPSGSAVLTSVSANTWTSINTSITIPNNTTNLLFFIWSNDAQVQLSNSDITTAMLYESTAVVNYRPVNHSIELTQATTTNNTLLKESLLYNPEFAYFQRVGPSITSVSNNTYGPDRWKVLTQTSSIQTTRQPSLDVVTRSSTNLLITQNQASAQKCGIIQFLPNSDTLKLLGQQVYFQVTGMMSNGGNIRVALLEWTGTADAPTTNVVNNWTSSSYTAGGFFNSSNMVVLGTNSVACPNGLLTNITLSGFSVDTSATNLAIMIWSEAAMAQSATMNLASTFLCVDDHPELTRTYKPRDNLLELLRCQRFYNKSYSIDTVPATVTLVGSTNKIAAATSTLLDMNIAFPVNMITTTTNIFTIYSPATGATGNVHDFTGNVDALVVPTTGYLSDRGVQLLTLNQGGNFTDTRLYQGHYSADCDF